MDDNVVSYLKNRISELNLKRHSAKLEYYKNLDLFDEVSLEKKSLVEEINKKQGEFDWLVNNKSHGFAVIVGIYFLVLGSVILSLLFKSIIGGILVSAFVILPISTFFALAFSEIYRHKFIKLLNKISSEMKDRSLELDTLRKKLDFVEEKYKEIDSKKEISSSSLMKIERLLDLRYAELTNLENSVQMENNTVEQKTSSKKLVKSKTDDGNLRN